MTTEAPTRRSNAVNYIIIGVLVVVALLGAVYLANRNASESDVLEGSTNGRTWKVVEDDGCMKLVTGTTEVVSGACNFENSILKVESRAVTLPDGTVVVYGAADPAVKEITVTGGGNSQTIELESRDGWDKRPFAVQVPGAVEGVFADGQPVAMPQRGT